jgi:hypothetical protein
MSTTNGRRKKGTKVSGNAIIMRFGRGLVSYMVSTEVCTSVNFLSHPSGGCWNEEDGV